MIDLGVHNNCICQKYSNTQDECINEFTIREQGKSVKLEPKNSSEKVLAIIIDKCVIKDNNPKCDALFLYEQSSNKYSFLVELKGAGDIPKAFFQLDYTRKNRTEYKNIIEKFQVPKQNQKYAIVSNGMLSKPELENLENQYKIRVKKILHCEATTPIPDLKEII
jgi:hypothetical protein